jgi:hypothetical protein
MHSKRAKTGQKQACLFTFKLTEIIRKLFIYFDLPLYAGAKMALLEIGGWGCVPFEADAGTVKAVKKLEIPG